MRQKGKAEEKFNWKTTLFSLAAGAFLIGIWLFTLASIAVATFTRRAVILYEPSEIEIVGATFLMLLGVVITSIQIAGILEQLVKKYKEGGVQ